MSEKLAEVYEQYDLEILSTRKGRGATILTTAKGLRILEPFRGNVTRLEQEYVLKQLFLKYGVENMDHLILNKEGNLLSCDKYRQLHVLKKHFIGNECDMHSMSDILRCVKALAKLHVYGQKVSKEFADAWADYRQEKEKKKREELRLALEDGEEVEKLAMLYGISERTMEEILLENSKETFVEDELAHKSEKSIEDIYYRHNKELKKIQQFIGKVKKKNAFENLFLQVFNSYYQQGLECTEGLKEALYSKKGEQIKEVEKRHYGICHGAYNHHNVILGEKDEAIVHFERFSRGNQLNDLYQFARKAMEKNHFDIELLEQIFHTYAQQIHLTKADYDYMYILFSYPEKFWKIANSYYNANKAFLSPKYLEKLEKVILQEKEKKKMLLQYYTFHLSGN